MIVWQKGHAAMRNILTGMLAVSALLLLSAKAEATAIFSDSFSSTVPGTYSAGSSIDSSFSVLDANVDVVGVLNGSFFSCVNNPGGNCVDLVGNESFGGIVSQSGLSLAKGQTYTVNFGSILQGYSPEDTAKTTFDVSLGAQTMRETLTAADAGHQFAVTFTPTNDEADALLSFDTVTAPDSVHGAVIDNVTVTTVSAVSAVPESSVWIMMLGGIAMMGAALRFGRKRNGLALAA